MCVLGGIGLAAIAAASAANAEGVSKDRSIVCGKARFEVLSPTLVRMEYSPTGRFVDDQTVSVLDRGGKAVVPVRSETVDGWLRISADSLLVRYKLDSGAFTSENLSVTWKDAQGSHSWKPGDVDDKNLGGVPPTMDGVKAPVTNPGPLSRNGYYLLDDSRSPIRDPKTEWIRPREEKDNQDWYFFAYGNDYPSMLKELQSLIGPIPMVPRYVQGVWFGSRASYDTVEWEAITERFREERIPLDILMLDSLSWTNVVWAGYDWDYEQMPDPPGFFKWAKQNGVRITMNEHYAALTPQNDHNFETIRKEMGLSEDTKEIGHDLANKKYADLYMNLLLKPALDLGMAFWWQDGWAGANMEGLDPCMWTREVEYKGAERITGKRAFIFCRLGSAWGTHRYGSYFTGDMTSNWPTLDLYVPATIRAGNMLVAYTNHDTAGIFGWDIDPELYHRWVQFATFSPIFRFHSIWGFRLPWEYGQQGIDLCRKFLNLRERMIPYSYTYGRIAHDTGMPIVRGMYLDYPKQEQSYAFDRQFMFGSEMLVAPITEPSHGRPSSKDVFLPAGDDWYDYFTGDLYAGGQVITHQCPIDRFPVFVKAGSIIPMAPEMDYSDQKPIDPLTLDIYAGARPAEFKIYEDDGLSLDYRNGSYAWTTVRFSPDSGKGSYTVEVKPAEGRFKGQVKDRRYIINLHGLQEPSKVSLGDTKLCELDSCPSGSGWTWDPATRVTTIRLTEPVSTKSGLELSIKGAGTFAESLALHKMLAFQERVRDVKYQEKLKYAHALAGREHAKPPMVIRRMDEVEWVIDDMLRKPSTIGDPDVRIKAMVQRVMTSFIEKPFDSTRSIPDINESCIEASKVIQDVTFTPEELNLMTSRLIGVDLIANVISVPNPEDEANPHVYLKTKLLYDAEITGDAKVEYSIHAGTPDSHWVAGEPRKPANGYTEWPMTKSGENPAPSAFTVHTTLTWEGGSVTASREITVPK